MNVRLERLHSAPQGPIALAPAARVALLSDLHLGDGSPGDLFGAKDDALLEHLARETDWADVLVLNGDIFDHMRCPRHDRIELAHPRVTARLRQLAEQLRVIYIWGNHDDISLLTAALPDAEYAEAVTVGDALCITHGHQFDLHWADGGAGQRGGSHFAANLHGLLEKRLRRPIRQPFRDYDNWANRVVHRLFFRWTQLLRLSGALWRQLGRPERYQRWQEIDTFWARGQWGDIGSVFLRASSYLPEAPYRTLVLGHTHHPGVVHLGDRCYANTGSWCHHSTTYGRIEAGAVRIFDALSGVEHRDEGYRMVLAPDLELPDMAAWFRRYYRGFFRYDTDAIHRDFPQFGDRDF